MLTRNVILVGLFVALVLELAARERGRLTHVGPEEGMPP
jgi:hypothetical protein